MDADHLDRCGESVGVFALIGFVERGIDVRDPRISDRAALQKHLGGVLLVLVPELAEAQEFHARRVDALGLELGSGLRLGLCEQLLDPGAAPGLRSASRVTK